MNFVVVRRKVTSHRNTIAMVSISRRLFISHNNTIAMVRFLDKHLLGWVSYNQGIATIESNDFCVSVNDDLLRSALVLQVDWQTLAFFFYLHESNSSITTIDIHVDFNVYSDLPIAAKTFDITSIDFHFEKGVELPLSNRPRSMEILIILLPDSHFRS